MKLRNRIKMLEMEEKRAQKKLSKTKQKSADIMELKRRNMLKEQRKREVLPSLAS